MKIPKNKKDLLPEIKKDISKFLTSEEGSINKKDAAKIAMTVLSLGVGLATLMKAQSAEASCSHASY